MMDQLIEVVDSYDEVQFLVSLDYCSNDADLYSCNEWADLYIELGDFDNNPLILNGDPDYNIWNMFANHLKISHLQFQFYKLVLF